MEATLHHERLLNRFPHSAEQLDTPGPLKGALTDYEEESDTIKTLVDKKSIKIECDTTLTTPRNSFFSQNGAPIKVDNKSTISLRTQY